MPFRQVYTTIRRWQARILPRRNIAGLGMRDKMGFRLRYHAFTSDVFPFSDATPANMMAKCPPSACTCGESPLRTAQRTLVLTRPLTPRSRQAKHRKQQGVEDELGPRKWSVSDVHAELGCTRRTVTAEDMEALEQY